MEAIRSKEPYTLVVIDPIEKRDALNAIYTRLCEVFGAKTVTPRPQSDRIETSDCCVHVLAVGEKLRGFRWREHRPTVVFIEAGSTGVFSGVNDELWEYFRKEIAFASAPYARFFLVAFGYTFEVKKKDDP